MSMMIRPPRTRPKELWLEPAADTTAPRKMATEEAKKPLMIRVSNALGCDGEWRLGGRVCEPFDTVVTRPQPPMMGRSLFTRDVAAEMAPY